MRRPYSLWVSPGKDCPSSVRISSAWLGLTLRPPLRPVALALSALESVALCIGADPANMVLKWHPEGSRGFASTTWRDLLAGVDASSMEAVREKGQVLAALANSRDWARESMGAMGAAELEKETELYGRTVKKCTAR